MISRDDVQARLLVAPAVLLLVGIAGVPILAAAWMSLHRVILVFRERRFVGLANYVFLARDSRFWDALAHTVYFAIVSVGLEFVLGLAFAVMLDRAVRGRALLRVAVVLPWAIPTVVSARMWAWMFEPDRGLIARMPFMRGVNWLGQPGYAMHLAIFVDVWKSTPFVALLLLAGLQTIPADLYRAARIDGASSWRIFRSITLPLLRPSILVALLFRTLDAFRVFDVVYVLTGGGPANTTETLSIYAFKTLMRDGDFGYGTTLAVATFACVMAISAVYLRTLGRQP